MSLYVWIKALHIIAVISWMAGMLYLPRLFVYHAQQKLGSEASEMLKIMELRLLRFIINPAMVAAFLFGGWLVWLMGAEAFRTAHWLHAKLPLVVVMAGVHGLLARHRKQFARDANTHSARYYRILNEVPTLLLVVIVILAVVKPF